MRAALVVALALAGCNEPSARIPAPGASSEPTAAMQAYARANARMHAGMAVQERDPDVTFAQGMTAHHRGAIEMARVELRYGRDPQLRALAQAVIAAQASEIALMERWLAKRGGAVPAAQMGSHDH